MKDNPFTNQLLDFYFCKKFLSLMMAKKWCFHPADKAKNERSDQHKNEIVIVLLFFYFTLFYLSYFNFEIIFYYYI